MSRDQLTRMDVDTGWAYDRKVRELQRRHPTAWPAYWAAYLALLGEAWKVGNRRLTIADAWVPANPAELEEATRALTEVGIIDRAGRIPPRSWLEWYGPVEERLEQRRTAGRAGAQKRWHGSATAPDSGAIAPPKSQNGDRMRHTIRAIPSKPAKPRRARGTAPKEKPEGPGANGSMDPERAQAIVDDPEASEEARAGARAYLELSARWGSRSSTSSTRKPATAGDLLG